MTWQDDVLTRTPHGPCRDDDEHERPHIWLDGHHQVVTVCDPPITMRFEERHAWAYPRPDTFVPLPGCVHPTVSLGDNDPRCGRCGEPVTIGLKPKATVVLTDPPGGPYVVTELSLSSLPAEQAQGEHPERTPVGPFDTRAAADKWASEYIARFGGSGSWSLAPIHPPR